MEANQRRVATTTANIVQRGVVLVISVVVMLSDFPQKGKMPASHQAQKSTNVGEFCVPLQLSWCMVRCFSVT